MRELKCPGNNVIGIIVDEEGPATGILEVRCGSVFCGKKPGIVVLHRINLSTGEIHTRRYSDPNLTKRKEQNGSSRERTPVRIP